MTQPHLCVAAPNSKSCETCAVRLRGQDLLEARLRRAQRAEAELQAKRVAEVGRKRECWRCEVLGSSAISNPRYDRTPEGQVELRKQRMSTNRLVTLIGLASALGGGR